MPEMPEVETIRRGLDEILVGREIAGLTVLNTGSYIVSNSIKAMETIAPKPTKNVHQNAQNAQNAHNTGSLEIGSRVTGIRRYAKVLIIDLLACLSDNIGGTKDFNLSIVTHLKMTGQLVWRGANSTSRKHFGGGHPTDSLIGHLPDSSTRVHITFADGSNLYFNDQRKFGWMRLMLRDEVEDLPFIKKLGPEPRLDSTAFDIAEFLGRIRHHKALPIKGAILDQSIVAGIGNIYADESLWQVKLHPATPVSKVSDDKLQEIFKAAADVMALSLAHGGSTDKNYVNAKGERGAYLDFANVFRREGLPCKRCGTTIIKLRVVGRGTHICPKCQRSDFFANSASK